MTTLLLIVFLMGVAVGVVAAMVCLFIRACDGGRNY